MSWRDGLAKSDKEKALYNGDPNPQLKQLADAFENTTVSRWVTGVLPASTDELRLFFLPSSADLDKAEVLNYPYPDVGVRILASSCCKATFGKGNKDVLDETYRKAGKLDFGRFSWLFKTDAIAPTIRANLMPFADDGDQLRFELYKLNVYGQGSFFKSHKDTPRGGDMFASLVLILPSHHRGGQLILKHDDAEHVFDAAKELDGLMNHVAFAAFYSDIDHEVREVIEGDRITITYNLYWSKSEEQMLLDSTPIEDQMTVPMPRSGIQFHATPFQNAIVSLLSDEKFMPNGGLLGFALQHLYPIPAKQTELAKLRVSPRLKGRDALLAHVCHEMSLRCDLRVVYYELGEYIVVANRISIFESLYDERLVDRLLEDKSGVITYNADDEPNTRVHWITPPISATKHAQAVGTYGNEPSADMVYSYFALIVGVGKFGERSSFGPIPPLPA